MARQIRILALAMLFSLLTLTPAYGYISEGSAALVNSFVPGPVYTPEAAYLTLTVQKTVDSLGEKQMSPSGFSFTLEELASGSKTTLKSDENGAAYFEMTYTEADYGVHAYRLYEEKTDNPAVVFSEQVYEVEVEVYRDAESGNVRAVMTLNDVETSLAPFRNVYDPALEPPKTGVAAPVGYACLTVSASIAAALTMKRRRG